MFTFFETNTEIIAAYLDQDTDMRLRDITGALEAFAPLSLQDGFDNAGLQIGLTEDVDTTGVLLCLDVTEDVVDEAIRKGCNVVVSHHPLLFRGLKTISDLTCSIPASQSRVQTTSSAPSCKPSGAV